MTHKNNLNLLLQNFSSIGTVGAELGRIFWRKWNLSLLTASTAVKTEWFVDATKTLLPYNVRYDAKNVIGLEFLAELKANFDMKFAKELDSEGVKA